MNAPAAQYPFAEMDPAAGATSRIRYLPISPTWKEVRA